MSTTHAQARALRKSQTDAEAILWSRLRNRQMAGRKFRRQVPLLGYVADFASLGVTVTVHLTIIDGKAIKCTVTVTACHRNSLAGEP